MNAARSVDGWRSLFFTAFNLSANPMVLLQPDRVLSGANDAFLKTFGYSRARALGRKLDLFVAEGSRQRMKKDWWELLRTGRLNGERQMVRADGRHVRVQFARHREIVTGRGHRSEGDRRPTRWRHKTADIPVPENQGGNSRYGTT
jgi:PAS domain S-box-containing protein